MGCTTSRLVVCAVAVAFGSATASGASFSGLGDFTGGDFLSKATGVSAGGAVVVGWGTAESGNEAFRWTAGAGLVALGHLPGGQSSRAQAVSSDGSVVAGWTNTRAFRWTAGGMIDLGYINPQSVSPLSHPYGMSDDGSVVVGRGRGDIGDEAFRWTSATGMLGMGSLPGGNVSRSVDASADGAVVVGWSLTDSGVEAFRWTAGDGMVGLGDLPGGAATSSASGVSADGTVVVGTSSSDLGSQAFRWTAGGMVALGILGTGSAAHAVSEDGSVVVGASGDGAFVWDATNGMRSLHDVLTMEFGLDLTGWTLDTATAVSANGQTIVGHGINPDGDTEAWIAVVPEPSTFWLASLAFSALAPLGNRRPNRSGVPAKRPI